MSPDNYEGHPFVQRVVAGSKGLAAGFPQLAKILLASPSDVRGLTLFLGDTNEYVVGLRTFGDDGTPMVCWSSGEDVLLALLSLDKRVGQGSFVVDKKAVKRTKPDQDELPF